MLRQLKRLGREENEEEREENSMRQGYTTIPDWMLEYDINIYETLILAVIYGFSQDGESRFQGSLAYLAKKAKCNKRTAMRALQSLMDKGLIEKIDRTINGVHLCDYRWCTKVTGSDTESPGGSDTESPQNISIENTSNNNTLSNKKVHRFEKPSIEEIRDYCQERHNSVDPAAFFNFYESKGWMIGKNSMKDWKSAVRTWEQREPQPRQSPRPAPNNYQRESAFQHNIRIYRERYGKDIDEQ